LDAGPRHVPEYVDAIVEAEFFSSRGFHGPPSRVYSTSTLNQSLLLGSKLCYPLVNRFFNNLTLVPRVLKLVGQFGSAVAQVLSYNIVVPLATVGEDSFRLYTTSVS
jgi:hypothetical protein